MNKDNHQDIKNMKICPLCKIELKHYIHDPKVQEEDYYYVRCDCGNYKAGYWYTNRNLHYEEVCTYKMNEYTLTSINAKNIEGTFIEFYSSDFKTYLDLNIERISFINGNPDLDRLFKRFHKLVIIS